MSKYILSLLTLRNQSMPANRIHLKPAIFTTISDNKPKPYPFPHTPNRMEKQ